MAEESHEPKLHVDADWKAQAQAEKQRLREQAERARAQQQADATTNAAGGPASSAGPSSTPGGGGASGGTGGGAAAAREASFSTLVSTMATQSLFAMGAIADPSTGQRYQNLDLARHHIDMLGVLEEKTKNNLTEEEATTLASTLYELRMRYVQLAQASRQAAQ